MTWRWTVHDLDLRVAFARSVSPTDLFTLIARFVVSRVTAVLGFVLIPLDVVMRGIGFIMIRLVILFMFLAVLDGIWIVVWGMLMGTSRLWLNARWTRPFILLPGMLLAIIAYAFIMASPDPHKSPKYTIVAREWPLSWHLWEPPDVYYDRPRAA